MIMAFDVNTEKFRKLALPDGLMDGYYPQTYLALFKEKLAFITSDSAEQPGFRYSIWVMTEYDVVESWNKLFVIGSFKQNIHWSAFTKYGSLILCFVNHRVERTGFEFVLIDTETLHEKEDPIQHPSYVNTFMESLILLDGANVVSY